jgi:hypothetical protein
MAYGAPPGYGGYHGPQGGPPQQGFGPPGYGAPAQPPKKKGMSGCLLAFLIVGGLFLVSAIGGGLWFYFAFKDFVDASGEMMSIVLEARNGPGAEEVRDLGCKEAISLDMKKLAKVAQRFEDAVAKREGREPKDLDLDEGAGYFVQCNQPKGKVTCQEVADTFIKAVKPKSKFVASVAGGSGKAECTETFDENGKSLGKAEAPNLQVE